jgi:site-specific DNA-methyltransferase (adenine-specific)
MEQALHFKRLGLNLHDTMIYEFDKPPLNDRRYEQKAEFMFVLSNGAPKTWNALTEKSITAGTMRHRGAGEKKSQDVRNGSSKDFGVYSEVKDDKVRGNIWRYTKAGEDKTDHPAMYPQKLAGDHIATWSNPGDLVLDPFSGSGTTAKAAKELGRRFLGFEINPEYCAIAERRIAQETLRAMLQWAKKDDPRFSLGGRFVNERFIEEAANGAAVVDTLKEEITGLRTVPTGVSKEARAQVVTPECERGEVFLPYPDDPGNEWVADLLSELRNFPNDVADDQVDAFTMALIMLRVEQKGGLTIPGRTMGRPAWQSPSGSGSLSLSKGLLDRLRQDDIRGSR